ncbi:EcoKI restriction-modification system protein HsdS [Serratia quinivorans]|uniref:restriction endonuclease subunit S n=1 Tax=Serratia quinivorans TaxID=137545 RepID=UPI00217C54F3|nr:restriction endonuclease subunit S [Serratia quinivorans]CAI2116261.1 EcoKI restriction-modification system protein HsdS [Serratia quinivorans]
MNNAVKMRSEKSIPAGYKQTEVGVIPEDWGTPKLCQICTLINGRGFKPYEWSTEGLPIIRIQNLNGSEEFNYYSGPYDQKLFIRNGQLLFAWSGSRGTSFGPHIWGGNDALLNYHSWKLEIKDEKIQSDYFFHILKLLTKKIEHAAHGASALVHTQKGEMEQFTVPMPHKINEQKAIATVLSDTDTLIISLEQLVVKKIAIKASTRQQLLIGRTRLSPFSKHPDGSLKGYKSSEIGQIPEDWDIKQLGQLVEINSGDSPSKYQFQTSGTPYFKVEQLNNGSVFAETTPYFICSEKKIKAGSVIFPKRGASIFSNKIRVLKYDSYMDTNLMTLTCSSELDSLYLYNLLTYRGLDSVADTTSIPQINNKHIIPYLIPLPPKEEQTAIATILSDMDAELKALEQKLAKFRAIKQGMMQQLLTGRIRLPLDRQP